MIGALIAIGWVLLVICVVASVALASRDLDRHKPRADANPPPKPMPRKPL